MIDDYVSFSEAADLVGVSKTAIYEAVKSGRLTEHRVMGKKALLRQELITTAFRGKGFPPDSKKTLEMPSLYYYDLNAVLDLVERGELTPSGNHFSQGLMAYVKRVHGEGSSVHIFLDGFGDSSRFSAAVVQVWDKTSVVTNQ